MSQAPKGPADPSAETQSFIEIVATLRGPQGCPWDKEQTHQSLAPYAVEEVHELIEALESGDDNKTKEELGDVLFQVVLHAQLASEREAFSFADVVKTVREKMIRRHPHVFGDVKAETPQKVVENWEALKRQEKSGAPQKNLDVPVTLPALQRAAKIGQRTHKLKFDWENAEQVWEKVREEMGELEEALDSEKEEAIFHEIGDMLFSLAQLSRHLGRDPEQILREGNRRFESRFEKMMELAHSRGLDWDRLSNDDKEQLWNSAKKALASPK